MSNNSKVAIFTIVSNNYLHFARTLLQSVRQAHPDFNLFCVIVDSDLSPAVQLKNEFTAVSLDLLNLPMGQQFLFQYTILELNTAVKPWAFEYLLAKQFDKVIYIDPDIYLYTKLNSVFELLDNTSDIVITPHLLAPVADDKRPSELDIRCSGTYNFGFCAVKNTPNTLEFIKWWQGKLETECIVDLSRGIFVDQSWIDLVPGLFDNVSILRHPGYNVAYWNVAQRKMMKSRDGVWFVNDWLLVFFHFSGFDPFKPEQFSKHQNRFKLHDLGPVAQLVKDYAEILMKNGAEKYRNLAYGFGSFSEGTRIPDSYRELYRTDSTLQSLMGDDPFTCPESLIQFVPDFSVNDMAPTYAMLAIWHLRSDLQEAFDIRENDGLLSYYHWFVGSAHDYFPPDVINKHKEILSKFQRATVSMEQQKTIENSMLAISRLQILYKCLLDREPDRSALKTYMSICETKKGYLKVWRLVAFSYESKSYPNFFWRLLRSFPWNILYSPALISSDAEQILVQQINSVADQSQLVQSPVMRILECWRKREDLKQAFPDAFATVKGAERFAEWLKTSGVVEEGFACEDADLFLKRRQGVLRVLMLYLQDNNLQNAFRFIFLPEDSNRFYHWLIDDACYRNIISYDDAAWFDGFAEQCPHVVAEITLGHGTWFHSTLVGGGTIFDLRHLQDLLSDAKATLSTDMLSRLYVGTVGYDLLAQAEQHLYFNPDLNKQYSSVFESGVNHETFIDAILKQLMERPEKPRSASPFEETLKTFLPTEHFGMNLSDMIRARLTEGFTQIKTGTSGVNLAGYFHSTTGMGEYARSMTRSLSAVGIPCKEVPLPTTNLGPWLDLPDLVSGKLATAHEAAFRTNIIVANGDDFPHVRTRLPYAFWNNRRNIGCWIWETEEFPESYSDTFALSEIWTPSEHSAAAIRKVVDIPVKVISLNLDFDELERAVPDRKKFGIPEDKVAFGFIFDCKSVIERKNPSGLIAAFKQAFGESGDSAVLVLKASSPEAASEEFSRLVESTKGLNVIWLTETLSREDTLNLLKSLDVYVSLHRCEGFGLTMAEAMALGKPVIASAYSSNLDFMTDEDSFLVRTPVIETDRDFGPYPAGTRWGDPDVSHAATYMKMLMKPISRNNKAKQAVENIKSKLSPGTTGKNIASIL